MQYFYKLTEGVVTIAAMTALMEHQDLFKAHSEQPDKVSGILVRSEFKPDADASSLLPMLNKMAMTVMQLADGVQLGEVGVVRLAVGGKLSQEPVTNGYSRYHLVLLGFPGALVTAGDEAVNMKTGDVWWIDAKQERTTTNKSQDDLIMLQIDVRA